MNNHILILDDSDAILDALNLAFNDEGYKTTTLDHCDNIIQKVIELKPDLILMDYLLFGINGGEYCHEIKTNPLTKHLPVILMSGYPRVIESLGNYGCDAFIAKPFELTKLLDTVKQHLPGKHELDYC